MKQHLRDVQLKELSILRAIRDVCEKNSIDYWLDGGSCLGAVRHKGFIPWDDDIDIAMRKEDVPRFIEAAERDLPKEYFLQTTKTDPSRRIPIIKVRDMNSFLVEFGDDFLCDYQKGLFVDIFPFIPCPTVSRGFYKKIVKGYCRANAILLQQHTYSWRSVAELFWFGGKRCLLKLMWNFANIVFSKQTFLGNTIETNGYGIVHKVKDIFPTSKILFEGEYFSAPSNPDGYLKDLFGNYMQLPPEDKRKGHAAFYVDRLT